MNIRRRILCSGDGVKLLNWVGSTGSNATSVEFELNIRLLSTMEVMYEWEVQVADWANMFKAAIDRRTTWNASNQQCGWYRNQSNSIDVLYFGTANTGRQLAGGNVGRLVGEVRADGIYLKNTTRHKTLTISTRQSVPEGSKMWITGYKIYSFKIWNNSELIHDFVPAKYKGEYGLYDTVTKEFIRKKLGNITGA